MSTERPFDTRGYNPLQVSTFITGDQWVFRAETGGELREILEGTAAEGEAAIDALNTLKQIGVAKGVFTGDSQKKPPAGGGNRAADSAPPGGGAPTCKHGPMKDLSDKGYKSTHYCTAKNRDEQCKPVNLR